MPGLPSQHWYHANPKQKYSNLLSERDMTTTQKSIAVFCGAKPGNNPKYVALAREFGIAMAQQNYRLVYGGGRVGLMGAIAEGALSAGGKVLGVMPIAMREREMLIQN